MKLPSESEPEPSFRPADSRSSSVPKPRLPRQLFWYLLVGGLTVVVDVGLLALLHESFGVPLGVATTVAYSTAVVVNFLLNRTAMSSRESRGLTRHALRYGSLVLANYVITLAVVTTAGQLSAEWYLVAKLAVVAGSTSWNFLLYRHWVFTPPRHTSTKHDRVPRIRRNRHRRDGRSVETSRQVLVVVPAHSDEEPLSSPDDRGRCLEDGSGAASNRKQGNEHRAC